jgi:hypothetical protein
MPLNKREQANILLEISDLDSLSEDEFLAVQSKILKGQFIEGFDAVMAIPNSKYKTAIMNNALSQWAEDGFTSGVIHVLTQSKFFDPNILRFTYDTLIAQKKYMPAVELLRIAKG